MDRARESLRSGDWLTRERIRFIATVLLLIASAAGFLFLVVTAHGVIDRQGRPLGTDFSNVYAAGTYVLDGDAQAPFDPPQQFAREQAIFGDSDAVLRLALSAVLFVRRRGSGLDALRPGARGLAGGDACALSADDRRDRCALSSGSGERRPSLAPPRPRLPGGADQYRPRPERLPHRGASRRRAGRARPPADRGRHSARPSRLQAAIRFADPAGARR